jgi:hypothetical protein
VIWIEREGFFLSTETVQAMFKLWYSYKLLTHFYLYNPVQL